MREYRGRDKNGEWHYGSLVMAGLGRDEPYIVPYANWGDGDYSETVAYKVEPETVGQYTGYDVNGKKLFGGDIVKLDYEPAWSTKTEIFQYSQTAWGTIVFDRGMFLFKAYRWVLHSDPRLKRELFTWQVHEMYEGTLLKIRPDKFVKHAKHAEIIGNIHDNPELLEVQQ